MQHLDRSNSIKVDPEGLGIPNLDEPEIQSQFNIIFDKIRQHPELEYINLKGNWMRAQELNLLATVLLSHKELQKLNLSYNRISFNTSAVESLKTIIKEHPNLKSILLDFNDIRDEFINELIENNSDDLNQRLKSIKISLSNNNFITAKSIDNTENRLATSSRLTMLVGNQIRLEDDTEYRERIMKQAQQLSIPAQSTHSSAHPIESDKPVFFTPFKDSSSQSLKRKSEDSPEKLKIIEEITNLDTEEFNAVLPALRSALENSKRQKTTNIIKSNG